MNTNDDAECLRPVEVPHLSNRITHTFSKLCNSKNVSMYLLLRVAHTDVSLAQLSSLVSLTGPDLKQQGEAKHMSQGKQARQTKTERNFEVELREDSRQILAQPWSSQAAPSCIGVNLDWEQLETIAGKHTTNTLRKMNVTIH